MRYIINNLVRAFVLQCLRDDRNLVVNSGKRDVYCKGLHSVVLAKDDEGRVTRLYYTENDHRMDSNVIHSWRRLPLPVHAHHCTVVLTHVCGDVRNIILEPTTEGTRSLTTYTRRKAAKGRFKAGPLQLFRIKDSTGLRNCGSLVMEPDELHTMEVPRGECGAWIVEEVGESHVPAIQKVYSNADLTVIDETGMYQSMTVEETVKALRELGLL